jgi:hypothetical protein
VRTDLRDRRSVLYTFRLEIGRDVERITWSLYFDVIETSRRRAFNAVHNHDRPEDIEWRARLTGEAIVVDGALLVVEESTLASVLDVPKAPPPAAHRDRRRRR